MKKNLLILNIDAWEYFQSLLISAVSTILGIRFYLEFTGYPQIGGGGLHIAHMLWGGFLMIFCIIVLLTVLNRSILHFVAILAGIGFGTFIDELGKFITSDNNYFFEPTIAIIYLIFITLFLLFYFFEKRHHLSQNDYLSNAFELTRQTVTEHANPNVRDKALSLLQKCDPSNPAVKNLSSIIINAFPETAEHKGIRQSIQRFYLKIMEKKWFTRGIIGFFIIFSIYNFWRAIDVISLFFRLEGFSLSPIDLGKLISSTISSIIVIFGILVYRNSQIKAYKVFKIGVLFSLFVTQFFNFYDDQLLAAKIFVFYILILFILNIILSQENLYSRLQDNLSASSKRSEL